RISPAERHLQGSQVDDARDRMVAQDPLQQGQVRDVTLDNLQRGQLFIVEDQSEPVPISTQVEGDHVALRLQQLPHDPCPDAAVRAGDEDGAAHLPPPSGRCAISSGSWYQLARSPTFARPFQRRLLGSRSIRSQRAVRRWSIRDRSSSRIGNRSRCPRTVSMVPLLVRHRPQSAARSRATCPPLTASSSSSVTSCSSRIAQTSSTSFSFTCTTCN